uniref:NADH dehydrogenase [ubiquinone] 1 beta subcomplex subunit 5, mitochondrial n=1 Tax=Peromyscus maniculatus bairdii TaxID=230844 RepID=A0A8C8TVE2_PERMB
MAAMSLLQRASVAALTALSGRRAGTRLGVGSFLTRSFPKTVAPVRHSGDHGKKMFVIKASSYYEDRFLRLLRFYILLTGIPVAIGITLVNIFIGEAELAEIPEGYIPEHWEYYKVCTALENSLAHLLMCPFPHCCCFLCFRLKEQEVRRLMRARGDGPWFQFPTPEKEFIDHSPKATPDN